MIYIDTSFLTPYYIEEDTSDRVEDVIFNIPVDRLAISDWSQVEFASLLARRLRMGEITREMLREVMTVFDIELRESYAVFGVSRADFEVATRFWFQEGATGLRAGDALHLAIAYNRRVERILSLDRRLITIVRMLGINADSAGIE